MDFMDLVLQYLLQASVVVQSVCFVLLIATCFFFWQFFFPSRRLYRELDTAIQELGKIKQRLGDAPIVVLAEIEAVMVTDELKHLWGEYAETLHQQNKLDNSGQSKITCYRATAMAEVFFAEQALVETPLRTSFYKHLPGILTGLGIIGTFSGLIYGLKEFGKKGADPATIQASLGELIRAVGDAFIVSAIAIGLAMLCTWWTNRELTLRYRQVERLCQLIDSFFDAGAGEEYLARLVEASETAATQSIQLKDALVTDLKKILEDLTNKQIEGTSSGVVAGLAGPIDKLSDAIGNFGVNQGDAVTKMLTDVLSDFSARMEKMFGGQLSGMSELLAQAAQEMSNAATAMKDAAANISTAGGDAAEKMAKQLERSILSMEKSQEILKNEMLKYIQQIRETVSQSQTESAQKLQETLGKLGEQVASVLGQIQDQSGKNADTQNKAVTNLSGQVEALIAQLVKTSSDLQSSVSALSSATIDSIEKMNSGAEVLAVAADDFAKAGQGVASTMKTTADASGKIQASAQTLSTATASVQQMFADYRRTSESLAAMLVELKTTVEAAKKEAGLTAPIVNQLKAAADQFGQAQLKADQYLQEINKVLTETHTIFSTALTKTLGESNRDFQKELGTAVNLLRGGIEHFGNTLDKLPGKKD